MPGNTVRINGADDMEWYVGDSKMDVLLAVLNAVGKRAPSAVAHPLGDEGVDVVQSGDQESDGGG